MRILVAGVGNLFLGDDGFGPEVARTLAADPPPGDVDVVDFGIRGVHLAYQLLDGYDRLLLIDAAPLGLPAGTVSVVAVEQRDRGIAESAKEAAAAPLVDAHGLDPAAVLRLLGSLGGSVGTVVLIACEPANVDEGIGLSEVTRRAVPHAVEAVRDLIRTWQREPEEVSP